MSFMVVACIMGSSTFSNLFLDHFHNIMDLDMGEYGDFGIDLYGNWQVLKEYLGLHEEVHGTVRKPLRSLRNTPLKIRPFFLSKLF